MPEYFPRKLLYMVNEFQKKFRIWELNLVKEIEIMRRTPTEMKIGIEKSVSYLEKGTRESCTSRMDLGDGRLSKFEDTVDRWDHYGKEYRKLKEKKSEKENTWNTGSTKGLNLHVIT